MNNAMNRNLKNFLFSAALVLSIGISGSATAFDGDNPWPKAGPAKAFTLPVVGREALDNGLTGIYVPFGAVPKVTIQLRVQTGNLNEEGKVWVADLAADMLKEGAGGASGSALALRAAEMGGNISISTSSNVTVLSLDVLSQHGPEAVALLGDIVMKPDFPEGEFTRLKQGYLRNLAVSKTSPRSIASEAFMAELYPDHPYGQIFPSEEALTGYTIEDAKSYYRQNFGAKRTDIYIVGQFDDRAMKAAVKDVFAQWAVGPDVLEMLPEPKTERLVKVIDRPGSSQSTLYFGLPVALITHADYTKLNVMNTLLGGAFSSRITRNIREDKGYTYSPRSSLSGAVGSRYWAQSADVTSEHTGDSLKEIVWEIKNLQDNTPALSELSGIQNYMSGIFVLRNGSRGGIIGQLAYVKMHGLDSDYLSSYVDRVTAITPDDIQAVAQKYLSVDDMTLVVVGVEEDVKAQLAKIGFDK